MASAAAPEIRGVRVFAFPATPRTASDAWVESIETCPRLCIGTNR